MKEINLSMSVIENILYSIICTDIYWTNRFSRLVDMKMPSDMLMNEKMMYSRYTSSASSLLCDIVKKYGNEFSPRAESLLEEIIQNSFQRNEIDEF